MTSENTATREQTTAVVSRHKSRAAAERAIDAIARREQRDRWSHRPEMVDIIALDYEIRQAR